MSYENGALDFIYFIGTLYVYQIIADKHKNQLI
jgi:hypothetical protein